MTRKLSRTKLNSICDAWDAGTLGTHTSPQTTRRQARILAKNNTGATLKTGANISLGSFSGSPTYAQAKEKMLNGGLILTISNPTSSSSSEHLATTLESIPAGGIGAINADIFFTEIEISSSSDGYATAAGVSQSSSSGAAYKILAKSGVDSSGNAICCLAKIMPSQSFVSSVLTASSIAVDNSGYLTVTTNSYNIYTPQ